MLKFVKISVVLLYAMILCMKKLKDFQNELNKCSKCGLCQDVCPIFELSSNECAVSKGKFIMLHGVTKR